MTVEVLCEYRRLIAFFRCLDCVSILRYYSNKYSFTSATICSLTWDHRSSDEHRATTGIAVLPFDRVVLLSSTCELASSLRIVCKILHRTRSYGHWGNFFHQYVKLRSKIDKNMVIVSLCEYAPAKSIFISVSRIGWYCPSLIVICLIHANFSSDSLSYSSLA